MLQVKFATKKIKKAKKIVPGNVHIGVCCETLYSAVPLVGKLELHLYGH